MKRASSIIKVLSAWAMCITAAGAQLLPQCDPTTNGTTYSGTAGSGLQLNSTTIRKIDAQDANQGVALDTDHFYSIDNFSITKHNKTTGDSPLQWYGGEAGPIIHLDGGVVFGDILYAPHSNYPQSPITSSVEIWNTTTMQHIPSHPLGIYRGSLTWIDQDPTTQIWYGTFANYDRVQAGQMLPYGLTMNTQLVQFNSDWLVARSWIFPDILRRSFSPMSNSGGSFGPDGWLYITGHDDARIYVLKLPDAGSTLIWVATIQALDIAGQGIAWDRSRGSNATLFGISREESQVVEMRVPLQCCSWQVLTTIGAVYGPGDFMRSE